DGKRYELLLLRRRYYLDSDRTSFGGVADIHEGHLVCTVGVIPLGQLDRVAGIPEVLEVHPLDHPSGVHVQARDHPQRHAHQPSPSVLSMAETASTSIT